MPIKELERYNAAKQAMNDKAGDYFEALAGRVDGNVSWRVHCSDAGDYSIYFRNERATSVPLFLSHTELNTLRGAIHFAVEHELDREALGSIYQWMGSTW